MPKNSTTLSVDDTTPAPDGATPMRPTWHREPCWECGVEGLATRTRPTPCAEPYYCEGCEAAARASESPPPTTAPELLRYLAVHEAGHMVVAHALGMRPRGVFIDDDQALAAIDPLTTDTPATHFLHCVVAYGGMCAHRRTDRAPGSDCHSDLVIAREHAIAHVGEDAPAVAVSQALALALTLADDVIHARWSSVMEVADLIQRRGEQADQREFFAILAHNARMSAELDEHVCNHDEPDDDDGFSSRDSDPGAGPS